MNDKDLLIAMLRTKLEAADEMARVCDQWVESKQIDSRSALADARIKYGKPFKYEFTFDGQSDQSENHLEGKNERHRGLIAITTDWFDEQPLYLERDYAGNFRPGFRFHLTDQFVIQHGWTQTDHDRNFTVSYVGYDADGIPTSASVESESSLMRDVADKAKREQAERERQAAVKNAKRLLFEKGISFDVKLIEPIVSSNALLLRTDAMAELMAYIDRIPGRFPAQVGSRLFEGKEFEIACTDSTKALIEAVEKKATALMGIKKNRQT